VLGGLGYFFLLLIFSHLQILQTKVADFWQYICLIGIARILLLTFMNCTYVPWSISIDSLS
jgi:hypothetical protein